MTADEEVLPEDILGVELPSVSRLIRSRFFWRAYRGALLLLAGSCLAMGFAAWMVLEGWLLRSVREDLARCAVKLSLLSEAQLNALDLVATEALSGFQVCILHADGRVRRALHPALAARRPELELARSWNAETESAAGLAEQRDECLALTLPLCTGAGFVRVTNPLRELQGRFSELRRQILLWLLLLLGASVAVAFWPARLLTAPILSLVNLVGSFGREGVEPAELAAEDETQVLRRAFKRLTKRLKKRVRRLARGRQELAAVLDGMVEGVIAVDREELVIHMNHVAGRLFSSSEAEARGKKIWEVIRVPAVIETVTAILESGTKERVEMRIPTRSEELIVEIAAAPFERDADARGNAAGAVLVFYDITRLRQLEAMRRDFMANVSHELKTPLTAIRGLLETVVEDDEMPSSIRQRFLRKAEAQTDRLACLVTDLLQLSRVESEQDVLKKDWLDCRAPLHEVMQRLVPVAENQKVELVAETPAEAVTVLGDDEALQQLFGNLVTNAIQYSPAGSKVEIRLRREQGEAILEVQDYGEGIEAQHQARIFERFYRVDRARSRELGGTGLGLSIVKHIAKALGGTVSVESALGQGSTFRVGLPLAESSLVTSASGERARSKPNKAEAPS